MYRRLSVSLTSCAALAAVMLSGCASDDSTSRLLVAPDKYVLYSCDEIAREARGKIAREQELRQLMAKAGTGAGRVVSGVAYDPDYLMVHGELNVLRATAKEKNCKNIPGEIPAGQTGAIH